MDWGSIDFSGIPKNFRQCAVTLGDDVRSRIGDGILVETGLVVVRDFLTGERPVVDCHLVDQPRKVC